LFGCGCSCADYVSTPTRRSSDLIEPRPLAPTSSGDKTNCAYSAGSTPPLAVTITNRGIESGTVSVDWYDALVGGNQVTNNSLSFTPPDTQIGRASCRERVYIYVEDGWLIY